MSSNELTLWFCWFGVLVSIIIGSYFLCRESFEKARDEKIVKRNRCSTCDRCFEHGADWAFEWCQEEMGTLDAEIIFLKNDKVQLQKQLDQQAKIIAELRAACEAAEKYHQGHHSHIGQILRKIVATVKEMESSQNSAKTP